MTLLRFPLREQTRCHCSRKQEIVNLFARAAEDIKSRNWLGCHRRMRLLRWRQPCDGARLSKARRPEMTSVRSGLNLRYAALGAHFATVIAAAYRHDFSTLAKREANSCRPRAT
jgi:hypothetical protein